MTLKYAHIFVGGNDQFRAANSFPRAKIEENCLLLGTDNVQGKTAELFLRNWVCCPSMIFYNTWDVVKTGEYHSGIP